MNFHQTVLSLLLASTSLLGCRATSGSESETLSLADAKVLNKSQINSDYWLVECENGITETHTTAEVVAQTVCETLPLYQFYNSTRKQSLYTTNINGAGPNYGLRGARFNILPYPMTNEVGQPLTQELVHCFDAVNKDHFLSVGNCQSPHESGTAVEKLGYVLKPNQAVVGATMQLLRCVRPASFGLAKDTKYSHDGQTCLPNYTITGSPMGILLRPFPDQISNGD